MLIVKQIKSGIVSNLASIILLILFQITALQITISQCYNKNSSFKAGEKLSYNVYYNFGFIKIKLADVKLWVEETIYNNKNVLIIQNTTATIPQYEWIIKVKDYYASYIDISTMKVERHIQRTLVDKYFTDYEYKFNHSEKKLYASIENSKTKKYLDTLNLNPCLHDLLSAVYYPRNIDYSKLSNGNKILLPVILDTQAYNIYYKYLGTENKNLKNKKNVNCIKIVPLLVATSIFKAGEKMTVWLSNDNNKVPLIMESELWIGKIHVQLAKYEGLRYPIAY